MDNTNNPNPRPDHLDRLLLQHLRALLPQIEAAALEALRAQMSWVELAGGATLMSQDEPGDAMYLLVSGRLRAYIAHDDGAPPRAVRDISRGQVVGEMSLYTDEPRSATLVAVRDSVLARLGKREFLHLLEGSARASIALTRQVIHRLQTEGVLSANDRPLAEVMDNARRVFARNPTGDFNWLPMLSLIKGRRLRRILAEGLRDLVGSEPGAEDLWKG